MDHKDLKKLAKLCRSLGISHFKCEDFEFTLSASEPTKRIRTNKKNVDAGPVVGPDLMTDSITEDQLLYWSTAGVEQ